MESIYYGEYLVDVIDNHYIILPECWKLPGILFFALVENKNGSYFLYCSEDIDSFQLINEHGKSKEQGSMYVSEGKRLLLPDGFLEYINKSCSGCRVSCYGNIDHFEIWMPGELKTAEDEIDEADIEKELQGLGLFI